MYEIEVVSAIQELTAIVARLRAPDGCPWDREQTHQSLCDCLIEEVAELLDTIDRLDMPHMCEELGDLLMHVVLQAQIAAEAGYFDFEAVAAEVSEKLVRRHPHVFGDESVTDSEGLLQKWEEIKAREKADKGQTKPAGVFKELPPRLPALLYARDVYKQIVRKSLDAGPQLKEAAITAQAENLDETTAGAALFELAAACWRAGIDPESALRRYTSGVVDRTERNARAGNS